MCSVPICVTADTKAVGLTGHQSNLQHAVHASAANRVVTWSARPFTLRSLACASNMNVSIASFPFGERPPSITRVGLFADRTRQKLISQRALTQVGENNPDPRTNGRANVLLLGVRARLDCRLKRAPAGPG
jgi:hypothetical protein